MEITSQVAQTMIDSRFHEYPQMKEIAESKHFRETLTQILDFESVDSSFFSAIETEVLIVLTLYAPLHDLAQNIEEATGLSKKVSEDIAGFIETLILQSVYDELRAYENLWHEEEIKEVQIPEAPKDVSEPLQLRPEGVEQKIVQNEERAPLTRNDVLQALAPKRTLASDVETLRRDTKKPVAGYEAYQAIKEKE